MKENSENRRGPFMVLGSIPKYRNNWISVRHDIVRRPDGSDGIFGVVTASTGSMILPMDNDGNIYLAREFRYASGKDKVELSGGVVDEGESPLEAAKRELKEELGLVAEEWISLGEDEPYSSYIVGSNHVFIAKGLAQTECQPDDGEIIDLVKMPLSEAVEMVMNGEINHSTSALSILKAHIIQSSRGD